MGPQLARFAGDWTLMRAIEDRRLGRSGLFEGHATFRPEGAVLRYDEAGRLSLGGATMAARQTHLWRLEGGRIHVSFADGRPFHDFDPDLAEAAARHDCAPDLYRAIYGFGDWPCWTLRWQVTGPVKDYTSLSRYRPANAAG
ncbi:trigger factor [Palleronia sediminis]|uniref:Trigger factor n=1 Tax=Palleronia sediminis TaxID=2547833 RepID=A0A4R6AB84_9RHOB|nr:DUF6314 family protein [Palleronia sediminis]TDL79578.1 trigger factor [Palleronia sediminis]